MPLLTHVGVITLQSTDSGTKAITGVGFQPKLVIFFSPEGTTNDSFHINLEKIIGAASSASDEDCITQMDKNGVGTTVTWKRHSTSCITGLLTTSGAVEFQYSMNSFDSDGFTLGVGSTAGTDRKVGYIALGGDDLNNAKVGVETTGTSSGSKSVTGIGFQANALIAVGLGGASADTSYSEMASSVGMVSGASSEYCVSASSEDNVATTNCDRVGVNNRFLLELASAGTVYGDAEFTSFDSGGFTYNITTAFASSRRFMYILMDVENADAGEFDLPNTTTADTKVNVTGVGFEPDALFMMTAWHPTYSVQDDIFESYGFATREGQYGINFNSDNGVGTSDTGGEGSTTAIMRKHLFDGTLQEEVEFSSFDSDGFTVNFALSQGGSIKRTFFLALGGLQFPNEWNKKIHLQTKTTYIDSGLDNDYYPCLVDESQVNADFWANVENGGGDIRCTTDAAGTNQVPIEVVTCNTSTEKLELWVYLQIHSSTVKDLYIWYDADRTHTQPDEADQYGRNAVWADYEAVYHLEESSGSALDATGNHDGTYTKVSGTLPNPVTGKIGSGQDFEYSDSQYIDIPDESDFDFTTSITVECWASVESLSGVWPPLVTKGDSTWRLHNYNGTNFARFTCSGLSGDTNATTTTNIADGSLHYIAGRYDGSNMAAYCDGSKEDNNSASGSIDTDDQPVRISQNSEHAERFWDGVIDEVRISGSALHDDWIKLSYYSQNSTANLWEVIPEGSERSFPRGEKRGVTRGVI